MCESEPMEVDKAMHDFIDVKKALMDLYEEQTLKILVCGKTGTGKSSLLNTLLGRELFKTGGPGETDGFTFDRVSQDVIPARIKMQNVLFEVFDSPGLQDGTKNDEQYLENMHQKCENVNLVLYCIDMTTTRWYPQDVKATDLLTKKFGAEFWKKTVLVLTKANMLKPGSSGTDETTFYKEAYDSFLKKFQTQLLEQGVPQDIATTIPAVAAGSYRDRYLPYVSKAVGDDSEKKCKDFLPELWLACFERMSHKSRFNFVKVTDYSNRLEVNREHLQREQVEFIENIEQKIKAKEKELQENERKLNGRIAQLNIEKQREIERIRRRVQTQYAQSTAVPVQQPQIIYRTEYRPSSDDGCFIL